MLKGVNTMNELMIFNNPEFGEITTDKQLSALGALAYILGEALSTDNKNEAWSFLEAASIIGHQMGCTSFNQLYSAVAFEVCRKFDHNEFYYQSLFKKNVQKIINGCSVIQHLNNKNHIPDAWVSWQGEILPVEVKCHDFDKKALEQLLRYMRFYHTNMGIAVGRRLTAKIPNNIRFVSLKELEDAEHE